ncbi:MAG: DUF615 domain-containing protein [Gammaproteobacteria bacterium]|nr:DUF615 domain-containing protein [Gammaproteobacteria bacterium]
MTASKSPDNPDDQDHDSSPTPQLSKTAMKKNMLALQKLGEELIELSPAQLGKIPLPEELHRAVLSARKMTRHRALYRQRQYIGKIMRAIDAEPIQRALDNLRHPERLAAARFHQVESWRDQMISTQGASATGFIDQYPAVDRQQLSQKIRAAVKEHETGKPAGAGRALFRFIDGILVEADENKPGDTS